MGHNSEDKQRAWRCVCRCKRVNILSMRNKSPGNQINSSKNDECWGKAERTDVERQTLGQTKTNKTGKQKVEFSYHAFFRRLTANESPANKGRRLRASFLWRQAIDVWEAGSPRRSNHCKRALRSVSSALQSKGTCTMSRGPRRLRRGRRRLAEECGGRPPEAGG